MTRQARLRCAIYTRKSSEEGLDQAFNSLHAQREACEAYIKSQAGEGWVGVKQVYDDGGFSGGSMERPGLKALLADVDRGAIDVVVVYKVDRLTRSLMDFARIVERFDSKSVSFVSVTQAFNTTTSMGRLTLNVLLSFAQFEREVTGERIRDKVAASKAKGMWMGGNPALGYDIKERQLVVNPAEADTVRMLFRRYLELGSVHALKAELDQAGIRTKQWTSRAGLSKGGQSFSRGALFHLLKSPLYTGKIAHKDQLHQGLHAAIIEQALFDDVQARLKGNARQRRTATAARAPLTGLIFDSDGAAMSPTSSRGKGGRVFRYYVSAALQQGSRRQTDDEDVRRVSAPQIEALVLDRLGKVIGLQGSDPWATLTEAVRSVTLKAHSIELVVALTDPVGAAEQDQLARVRRGLKAADRAEIKDGLLHLVISGRPVFRGGRTWLLDEDGRDALEAPRLDRVLVAALRKAHAQMALCDASPSGSLEALRRAVSPKDSYMRRVAQLVFLAPDIQQAILDGRQPGWLTAEHLMDHPIPLAWSEQRAMFGFPASSH